MRRRRVLTGSCGLVFSGLSGCLTNVGSDGGASTPEGTAREGPAETGSTTAADSVDAGGDSDAGDDSNVGDDSGASGESLEPQTGPAISDTGFRSSGGGCGDGIDEASASFEEGGVTVTGTISGRDACMHPRLASATYDADADELAVLVETYAGGDVCSQCLVDLGYEATVRLEVGRPGAVVVRHGSRGEERTVTRAAP